MSTVKWMIKRDILILQQSNSHYTKAGKQIELNKERMNNIVKYATKYSGVKVAKKNKNELTNFSSIKNSA